MNKRCARCGAENREEARFCVGCGGSNFKLASVSGRSALVVPCPSCRRLNRPGTEICAKCGASLLGAGALTAPAPLPAAPASSPEPDAERQVGEVVDLPGWALAPAARPRSGMWIAAAMVAVIVFAAAAWVVVGRDAPEPDPDESAPLLAEPARVDEPTMPLATASRDVVTDDAPVAVRPAPAPAVVPVPALVAASSVMSKAAAPEREKRAREARARAALEQQRVAEQERTQREAQAARQRAAVPQPEPTPTAVPAPVAAKAAPPKSVRELCAGRNFISEQLCLSSECRDPIHAKDPICVKRKELEDINNRRTEP